VDKSQKRIGFRRIKGEEESSMMLYPIDLIFMIRLKPYFTSYFNSPSRKLVVIYNGKLFFNESLAFAFVLCNRYKCPNIGSFDPETNLFSFSSTRVHKIG
jgi:hypothetical protein